MKALLILYTFAWNGVGGVSSQYTFHELPSMAACEMAGKAASELSGKNSTEWRCVSLPDTPPEACQDSTGER